MLMKMTQQKENMPVEEVERGGGFGSEGKEEKR